MNLTEFGWTIFHSNIASSETDHQKNKDFRNTGLQELRAIGPTAGVKTCGRFFIGWQFLLCFVEYIMSSISSTARLLVTNARFFEVRSKQQA